MESLLQQIALVVAVVLEAVAIVIIAIGGLAAIYKLAGPMLSRRMTHGVRRAVWLGLARWLVLGLEFMLAADIVRTVIEPTWEGTAQLVAIALIRTFLNYFLERDLDAAMESGEIKHEQLEHA